MIPIVWAVWVVLLVATTVIFWFLWRYADRIEKQEALEGQWRIYLDDLWRTDPQKAAEMQSYFETRILK